MEKATKGWFEGAWSVERTIDDRLGPPARLSGTATFSPQGDGLAYAETGTLEIGGRSFAAQRRYRWVFGPDGRIRVMFEDGRPFHAFRPSRPAACHLCGDDRYRVAYAFDERTWRSRWRVRGPAKDYIMETRYTRL